MTVLSLFLHLLPSRKLLYYSNIDFTFWWSVSLYLKNFFRDKKTEINNVTFIFHLILYTSSNFYANALSGDSILYYFAGNINSKDKRIYFASQSKS